jgi:CelD/BcsL family acetyltransferase involved in cellulose biosynthesis
LKPIERIEAPVLDMRAGWEEVFRAKIHAHAQKNLRRRRGQLARLGKLGISIVRSRAELEPALEEAFGLHALRWQGRFDDSNFGTASGRRFYRAAIAALAEIDVPRIVTLRLDGRAIAFRYWFALLVGCTYTARPSTPVSLSSPQESSICSTRSRPVRPRD